MLWTVLIYVLLTETLLHLLLECCRERRRERRRRQMRDTHTQQAHPCTTVALRAPLVAADSATPLDRLNLSTIRWWEERQASPSPPRHNMGSRDMLGYGSFEVSPEQQRVWEEAQERFGCGSCGPRSFYGTMDAHRSLEAKMAAWWGYEDALLYSGWKQLVLSLPYAFASGKGHVVVYDEAVRHPIIQAVDLARCTSASFRHNDMKHLEQVLSEYSSGEQYLCLFLYVEGVYLNRGTVCHLRKVADLSKEYGFRLIVDDTMGFGILGSTRRGTLEHCDVQPSEESMLIIGLDAALGSVGAVCLGSKETIQPQHTAAPGFLFSASSPPFHLECASAALTAIGSPDNDKRLRSLQQRSEAFLEEVHALDRGDDGRIYADKNPHVPIYHLYVTTASDNDDVDVHYTLTLDIEEARMMLQEHDRYAIECALDAVSRELEEELGVRVPRVMHERRNRSLHPPCLRVVLGLANCPETYQELFRILLERFQSAFNVHYYK